VGQVRSGLQATFGVDAYPGRRYPARIARVGYGSQTKDGVVSYKTILNVRNDDLSLRPGMTATAEIVAAERKGVLRVPNAALRFTPPSPSSAAQPSRSLVSRLLPRPPAPPTRKNGGAGAGQNGEHRVHVLRDGQPVEVPVKVGITDGRTTEVAEGALQAGAQVITDAKGALQ
jgi:HlyD family secretion protein